MENIPLEVVDNTASEQLLPHGINSNWTKVIEIYG